MVPSYKLKDKLKIKILGIKRKNNHRKTWDNQCQTCICGAVCVSAHTKMHVHMLIMHATMQTDLQRRALHLFVLLPLFYKNHNIETDIDT